jgi:hypothetical protein
LFNETFDAHDALEDVIALRRRAIRRFVFRKKTSYRIALQACFEFRCTKRLPVLGQTARTTADTEKGKLYSDAGNDGAISTSMAEKIAGSGLNFDDLQRVFAEFGKKGLFAILSKPPTSHQQSTKPRVTKTPRILSSILTYFERQHEQCIEPQ